MKFELPPQRGRIIFEGVESAKFWIRAFGLEPFIAIAQARFAQDAKQYAQAGKAVVPIISEFVVDPEHLIFYYVIHLELDLLGIASGMGMVLFTDQQNAEVIAASRDEIADRIMDDLRSTGMPLEQMIIPSGKEA